MSDPKTRPTRKSVEQFLATIADDERRRDCRTIVRIMQRVTKAPPTMWGPSIVGFGRYHYKYGSGREGDWFLTGFSPRKQGVTLYVVSGFERYGELLARLGKHKIGKSCLSIKRLRDVDLHVLEDLVAKSVAQLGRARAR